MASLEVVRENENLKLALKSAPLRTWIVTAAALAISLLVIGTVYREQSASHDAVFLQNVKGYPKVQLDGKAVPAAALALKRLSLKAKPTGAKAVGRTTKLEWQSGWHPNGWQDDNGDWIDAGGDFSEGQTFPDDPATFRVHQVYEYVPAGKGMTKAQAESYWTELQKEYFRKIPSRTTYPAVPVVFKEDANGGHPRAEPLNDGAGIYVNERHHPQHFIEYKSQQPRKQQLAEVPEVKKTEAQNGKSRIRALLPQIQYEYAKTQFEAHKLSEELAEVERESQAGGSETAVAASAPAASQGVQAKPASANSAATLQQATPPTTQGEVTAAAAAAVPTVIGAAVPVLVGTAAPPEAATQYSIASEAADMDSQQSGSADNGSNGSDGAVETGGAGGLVDEGESADWHEVLLMQDALYHLQQKYDHEVHENTELRRQLAAAKARPPPTAAAAAPAHPAAGAGASVAGEEKEIKLLRAVIESVEARQAQTERDNDELRNQLSSIKSLEAKKARLDAEADAAAKAAAAAAKAADAAPQKPAAVAAAAAKATGATTAGLAAKPSAPPAAAAAAPTAAKPAAKPAAAAAPAAASKAAPAPAAPAGVAAAKAFRGSSEALKAKVEAELARDEEASIDSDEDAIFGAATPVDEQGGSAASAAAGGTAAAAAPAGARDGFGRLHSLEQSAMQAGAH